MLPEQGGLGTWTYYMVASSRTFHDSHVNPARLVLQKAPSITSLIPPMGPIREAYRQHAVGGAAKNSQGPVTHHRSYKEPCEDPAAIPPCLTYLPESVHFENRPVLCAQT